MIFGVSRSMPLYCSLLFAVLFTCLSPLSALAEEKLTGRPGDTITTETPGIDEKAEATINGVSLLRITDPSGRLIIVFPGAGPYETILRSPQDESEIAPTYVLAFKPSPIHGKGKIESS